MSKQQKLSIAGTISLIIGILSILSVVIAVEHRLTVMETRMEIIVETQSKIVSKLEKIDDQYLTLSRGQKCLVIDSRKPKGHLVEN